MYIQFKIIDSNSGEVLDALYPFRGIKYLSNLKVTKITVDDGDRSIPLYAESYEEEHHELVTSLVDAIKSGVKVYVRDAVFSENDGDVRDTYVTVDHLVHV